MKKIISTQGLISGTFDAPLTNRAIHERIDNRLVDAYRENHCDDIQVIPAFKYQLADGQVTAIELTSQRRMPSILPLVHTSSRFLTYHITAFKREPSISLRWLPGTARNCKSWMSQQKCCSTTRHFVYIHRG